MFRKLARAFLGKSATVNFNALGIALFAIDVISGSDIITGDTAVIIGAIGNILLRFKTNKPLEDK